MTISLEPRRESFRARRRLAAYAKVVDELDDGNSDGSDDSDLDDDLYPTLHILLPKVNKLSH